MINYKCVYISNAAMAPRRSYPSVFGHDDSGEDENHPAGPGGVPPAAPAIAAVPEQPGGAAGAFGNGGVGVSLLQISQPTRPRGITTGVFCLH